MQGFQRHEKSRIYTSSCLFNSVYALYHQDNVIPFLLAFATYHFKVWWLFLSSRATKLQQAEKQSWQQEMLREDSKLMTTGPMVPGIRLQTNNAQHKVIKTGQTEGYGACARMKLCTCSDLFSWPFFVAHVVAHWKIWVGKKLVRQTLSGKSVQVRLAAYVVTISLEDNQILFSLKTNQRGSH